MSKQAKQILRREIKQRLSLLSDSEKLRQSQILTSKLTERVEYKNSERISVFLSMPDEIKTEGILKHIFSTGRKCYIPRYIGMTMEMIRLYSWDDYVNLPETSWKIKQPRDDEVRENALDTGGLDLILMPGLAFSKAGARLGRGKGYYDTYLQRCEKAMNRKPVTIALAFKEQICESVPTTDHDVPIDIVLFDTDQ